MTRRRHQIAFVSACAVITFASVLTGCGNKSKAKTKVLGVQITTSTAPTTTTTIDVEAAKGLNIGATGAAVTALQQRLGALHYDVAVTGKYDRPTWHGVMAFQKTNGLPRTGRANNATVAALNTAHDPAASVPGGGATRIEVDIPKQVLRYYKGGTLNRIISVSTGSGRKYCVDGVCEYAVTPGGRYRITRRIKGRHESKLGSLWNPMYFNRGIAIHGAMSVPAYPASHGCVRVPMNSSPWLYADIPNGTPVYVIGGPANVPPPFADNFELKPGETAPPDDDATTTTIKQTPTTVKITTTTAPSTTTTS